ncbi:hypothetical protein C8R46DRAFT_1220638 [Mycena filopes]|nr:hypothetical protein C8R46DRAFT_1220638 [Mycena filopes]
MFSSLITVSMVWDRHLMDRKNAVDATLAVARRDAAYETWNSANEEERALQLKNSASWIGFCHARDAEPAVYTLPDKWNDNDDYDEDDDEMPELEDPDIDVPWAVHMMVNSLSVREYVLAIECAGRISYKWSERGRREIWELTRIRLMDGEGVETAWASLGPLSSSLSSVTPSGQRHDSLDTDEAEWNWRKFRRCLNYVNGLRVRAAAIQNQHKSWHVAAVCPVCPYNVYAASDGTFKLGHPGSESAGTDYSDMPALESDSEED